MNPVTEARYLFSAEQASGARVRAAYVEAKATADSAKRAYGEESAAATAAMKAFSEASSQIDVAQARIAAALDELTRAREAALRESVDADIQSLDAGVPLALLPVRVETWFDTSGETRVL